MRRGTRFSPRTAKRALPYCKKNIYSVVCGGGVIGTVSQDATLRALIAESFEPLRSVKGAVKGMTRILGVCGDNLVIADGGISLWDKRTLTLNKRLEIPTGHFNKGATLCGNVVFGSDYHAIYSCEL